VSLYNFIPSFGTMGAGSVPRKDLGSFMGPAKRTDWPCTIPWDMKLRSNSKWCGASPSSITITTEPTRKPPPRISIVEEYTYFLIYFLFISFLSVDRMNTRTRNKFLFFG
jgi:hypothetical protein